MFKGPGPKNTKMKPYARLICLVFEIFWISVLWFLYLYQLYISLSINLKYNNKVKIIKISCFLFVSFIIICELLGSHVFRWNVHLRTLEKLGLFSLKFAPERTKKEKKRFLKIFVKFLPEGKE